MEPPNELTTLFLDLNAYFASVEQHLEPALRGRPVAVVPVMKETGCCIAASYEAKAHGVRTGTRVAEARRLCPGIAFVPSRPEVYTRIHHQIIAAVETCIPIEGVYSIDEMSCRLDRRERPRAAALELAGCVKRAIRERVGETLRCSIGLAQNRFLAKVATDMEKPDGLVVIEPRDLPHVLYDLELTDLPGIADAMQERLHRHGVYTVAQLCDASQERLRTIWGGIVGERWWHWLRGGEPAENSRRRHSIGHQHVLPPEFRTLEAARGVTVRLLLKAAARLRHARCLAGRIVLAVGFPGRTWVEHGPLHGSQDSLGMLEVLGGFWDRVPAAFAESIPNFVGVTLCELEDERQATAPLFPEVRRRANLSKALDGLNQKFGRNAVYVASMHAYRESAPGGIAFGTIPNLDLPDSVGPGRVPPSPPKDGGPHARGH